MPQLSHDEAMPLPTTRRPGSQNTSRDQGVEVFPFRGWRIAPAQLAGLAARYATPWDQDAGHQYTSAAEATNTFRAWQRTGALVRDTAPALYAYEQTGPRGNQLGLLAAVHLDSTVLPHEEVIPSRVEGIAELVRAGQMNLDPLLLGYSGDGRTNAHLAETVRQPPVTDVVGSDGQRHRLWHVNELGARRDIRDELSTCAAFIADGHHRHIAARQVQRQFVADGYREGPWDLVSALLVDVRRNDLRLAPIHRILPFTEPNWALNVAAGAFRVTPLQGALEHWLRALKDRALQGPAFVVVTARGAFLLADPAPRFLSTAVRHWPRPLQSMHLGVLHAGLIETVWQTPDPRSHIWYEASATRAVQKVREAGGIAVLLTAPTHADLGTAASAGVRLPFKAASFVPKPHPGLVFRSFHGD
jgi:hypothetical protein